MPPLDHAEEIRISHIEANVDRLLADYHDGPQGQFGVRTKVLLMWHAQWGLIALAGAVFGWVANEVLR